MEQNKVVEINTKAITSRINKDNIVITISKELILGLFEDSFDDYYKIKNKKKFFEAFAKKLIVDMEYNDDLSSAMEGLMTDDIGDTQEFIKEIEDEEEGN